MAGMTGEQLEDSFMQQVYTSARAAGDAAREAGRGVICARFVLDEAGLGTFDLCAESLDFKTLSQVALHVGTHAAGRSLFELFLQTEDGEWDALFSAEQFSDFRRLCAARLQQLQLAGRHTVNVKFKLVKVADPNDLSAARNVDAGRKRLHYGTEEGWADGPTWAAKRAKDARGGASFHPLGGDAAKITAAHKQFFGHGSAEGLVSAKLLHTGGLKHFGDKSDWEYDDREKKYIEKPVEVDEFATAGEVEDAKAVKPFVWLWRVASSVPMMQRYNAAFPNTDALQKFLLSLRSLEINAKLLHTKFLKDLIFAKNHGVVELERIVFQELLPVPAGGIKGYTAQLNSVLTAAVMKERKEVLIDAATLLNKALALYTKAAFTLRDELLSKQLATLAVQLSALDQTLKQIVIIRFPALLRAHELTSAHAVACAKMSTTEVASARVKLQRDVAAVAANLPTVQDIDMFDVAMSSVGLAEAVAPGLVPKLVQLKDLFLPVGTLAEDGPESLFAAALASRLGDSWFGPPQAS